MIFKLRKSWIWIKILTQVQSISYDYIGLSLFKIKSFNERYVKISNLYD